FSASIATSRYAPKQGVREAENGTTSAHPLSTAARATLPRWSPSHYRTARSPEGQPRIPGELPLPLSTRWIPPAEAFWRGRSHARCRKKETAAPGGCRRSMSDEAGARRPHRSVSVEHGLDELREVVARTVEPALYRAEVDAGDLGNLLVRLAFHLAAHDPSAVVSRLLCDRSVHPVVARPLPVRLVRAVRVVLPPRRAMVGVPVLLARLEQDHRIARAVTQLVLRQVARDRVHPGRELLG